MEVLILGGTGAMGIHLIECLVAKGIFVTVTSRKDRDSAEYVTYVKGNAHDVNFLTTLLERKRWDVIVDFMVYSTEEFRDRVELLLKSTKQYIFLVQHGCMQIPKRQSWKILRVFWMFHRIKNFYRRTNIP